MIKDIVLDPADWQIAYAVDSSHVFRTGDGGQTWRDVTGSLRITDLTSVELIKRPGRDALFVGGLGGVYRAFVPDAMPEEQPQWVRFGFGFPNVLVTDLDFDSGDDVLIAATLGRGVWTMPNASGSLGDGGLLRIEGGADADSFRLVRNAGDPSWLDVYIGEASTPDRSVPLATLERIEIVGLAGNDVLTIDSSHGVISVPDFIRYDGGTDPAGGDTDRLILLGADGTTDPFLGAPDADGQGASVVIGRDGVQTVRFQRIEVVDNVMPDGPSQSLVAMRDGLQHTADWTGRFDGSDLLGTELPLLGTSLGRSLDGVSLAGPEPVEDPGVGSAQGFSGTPGAESQILRRLIETGLGGFSLSDIGDTIATTDALRERLDGLDDIPGNVVLTQIGDVTRYDVQVRKPLRGTVDLDMEAFGGNLTLGGTLEISANLTLHLIVGVDARGFFIDAGGSPGAELLVDNFHVDGHLEGRGRVGFLEVVLTGTTLTMDPDVRVSLDLREPGPDPFTGLTDGLIRVYELDPVASQLASVNVQGNPVADDMVLKAFLEVSALLPDLAPPFTLGNAAVTLTWAEITDPASLTVSATTTGAQELFNFLNVTPEQVVGGLEQVQEWLESLRDSRVGDSRIPFVENTTVGDIADGADAFLEEIIRVVESASGQPRVLTVQELLSQLPEGTGIDYDPATNTLTYRVSVTHASDPVSIPVDLEAGVDGLAEVETASTVTVNPSVTMDFTFGLDLSELLSNEFLLDDFFIRDAVIRVTAAVDAPDIDAAARLGPFRVAVQNGSGSATAEITLPLEDPGTGAVDGRISLAELRDSLVNPGAVVRAPTVDLDGRLELPITTDPFHLGDVEVALDGLLVLTESAVDFSMTADIAGIVVPGLEILAGSTVTFDDDTGLTLDASARAFGATVHLTGAFDPGGAFAFIATADDVAIGPLTVDLSGTLTRTIGGQIDYYLQGFVQGELVPGLAILPGSVVRLGRDEGLEIDATANAFGATVHVTGDFNSGNDFSFAASANPFDIAGATVTLTGEVTRAGGQTDWGLAATIADWEPVSFISVDELQVTLDQNGIGFETTAEIAGVEGIHLTGDYRLGDATFEIIADLPVEWTLFSGVELSNVFFTVTNRNDDDSAGDVRALASADLELFGTDFAVAASVSSRGFWAAATPDDPDWSPIPGVGLDLDYAFLVVSSYDFVIAIETDGGEVRLREVPGLTAPGRAEPAVGRGRREPCCRFDCCPTLSLPSAAARSRSPASSAPRFPTWSSKRGSSWTKRR